MVPIIVLEHAFSMPGPAGGISESAVNLLQRLIFYGEGKMTALKHLTEFIDICNRYRIVCESNCHFQKNNSRLVQNVTS